MPDRPAASVCPAALTRPRAAPSRLTPLLRALAARRRRRTLSLRQLWPTS